MHPAPKLAVYLALLMFSWSAATYSGGIAVPRLEALTSCAPLVPGENTALARAYLAHFLYYFHQLLGEHRDNAFAVHHVTTTLLVPLSWLYLGTGGLRLGVIVMFLHGTTDAVFQITRMCPKGPLKVAAGMALLSCWALLRLWHFGHVLDAVRRVREVEQMVCTDASFRFSFVDVQMYWTVGLSLLSVLWCLNVYWLCLIAQKLGKLVAR